jgi:conjugative transfer signal peptidase TraF
MRRRLACRGSLAFTLLAVPSLVPLPPLAVGNTTPSVPLGLYRVAHGAPQHGDLALLALPARLRAFAAVRGYLASGSLLIKPVAGLGGTRVCRSSLRVWVSGRAAVSARNVDARGRPLPRWWGCRRLGSREIFVLGSSADSFDSRYFGAIDSGTLVGIAVPIWTLSPD